MLRLYFNWNAVCAQKVVLCLTEKGIDWTPHHLVLSNFEQLEPWYLDINPAGLVPALVHDDVIVTESTVINEYLEDAFPEVQLRPTSPAARARMRWWTKQIDDVLHPSIRPISFTKFVTPRAARLSRADLDGIMARTPKKEIATLWRRVAEAPYSDQELADYLAKIRNLVETMETALSRSRWLAGDGVSLADLGMTPYFRRLVQLEKEAVWSDLPATCAWWDAIRARPSFAMFDRLRAQYAPADHPANPTA